MAEELNFTKYQLMSELFKLSQQVSSYVIRIMGVGTEQTGPPTTEEEFQLGSRLAELGAVIQARATGQGPAQPQSTTESTHENTRNLLEALRSVNEQLPRAASDIASERITPEEQVEFAELVIRVGELVKLHAWELRGFE